MRFVVVQSLLLAALLISFAWRVGRVLVAAPPIVADLGKIIATCGAVLAVSAVLSLKSATRLSPEPSAAELVDRGIYRYLRHPMYSAAILVAMGLILIQPRLPVVVTGGAVILFYLVKTRYEETLLVQRYPEYAAYRARTLGVLFTTSRQERTRRR